MDVGSMKSAGAIISRVDVEDFAGRDVPWRQVTH